MILLQLILFVIIGFIYYNYIDNPSRSAYMENYLDCVHGSLSIQHSPRCNCENNWDGISCDMCLEKTSCSGNQICDTSLLIGNHKKYECDITSENLQEIAGDTLKLECGDSTCDLTAWGQQPSLVNPEFNEYHKVFRCIIYNITSHYDYDTKTLTTLSDSSLCQCYESSEYCKEDFLVQMLDQMIGSSKLNCNLYTKNCDLDHSDFPGLVLLHCNGAGCLDQELTYPNDYVEEFATIKTNWKGVVVDVLTLIFIMCILLILFLCMYICCLNICKNCLEGEYQSLSRTPVILEFKITGYNVGRSKILRDMRQDGKYMVRPGVTALLGPSAAGKTTLMNILSGQNMQGNTFYSWCLGGGLHRDTKVWYNGFTIGEIPVERIVEFVEQEIVLTPFHSIRREINFSSGLRNGDSRTKRKDDIDNILIKLNLIEDENKRIGSSINRSLSGGEKKRVAIAIALTSGARVIFMDEPTSGLDGALGLEVLKLFHTLAKERHVTVFISIHQPQNKYFDYFDEIMYMNDGKILIHGSKKDLIDKFNYDEQIKIEELVSRVRNETKKKKEFKNDGVLTNCKKEENVEIEIVDNKEPQKIDKEDKEEPQEIEMENISLDINTTTELEIAISSYHKDSYDTYLTKNAETIKLKRPQRQSILNNNRESYEDTQLTIEVEEELTNKKYRSRRKCAIQSLIGTDRNSAFDLSSIGRLQSSPIRQFRYIATREFYGSLYQWKPIVNNLVFVITVSIIIGALYYKQENGVSGSQNRLGFLFFFCLYLGLTSMPSLNIFSDDIKIQYWREFKTGYYSQTIYACVRMLANFIKYRFLPPIIFSVITYQMIGLHGGLISTHFMWFLFIVMMLTILTDLVCVIVGTLCGKVTSVIVFTCVLLFNVLTSGLVLNISSIPNWVKFAGYLGDWKMAYEALMINEFIGLIVTIDPKGFPPYETKGIFWLVELGMHFQDFDFDVSMLLIRKSIYVVVALILFVLFLKVRK